MLPPSPQYTDLEVSHTHGVIGGLMRSKVHQLLMKTHRGHRRRRRLLLLLLLLRLLLLLLLLCAC